MHREVTTSVTYTVEISLGGLGLCLFSLLNGGRSVQEVLVGDNSQWAPAASADPWTHRLAAPRDDLLGGSEWGELIDFADLPTE